MTITEKIDQFIESNTAQYEYPQSSLPNQKTRDALNIALVLLETAKARAARAEQERDEALGKLAVAKRALEEVKRVLAVGRNVGEDKEQAYEDAEETADCAVEALK